MARPRVSRLVAYLRFVGRRWRLRGLFVVATRVTFNIEGACFPDGSFNAGYNSYNFWSTCGIFQITLGFGELSFSTVKLIDVVWDVVRTASELVEVLLLTNPTGRWPRRTGLPCLYFISSLHEGSDEIDGT